jgi:hypothetical protein
VGFGGDSSRGQATNTQHSTPPLRGCVCVCVCVVVVCVTTSSVQDWCRPDVAATCTTATTDSPPQLTQWLSPFLFSSHFQRVKVVVVILSAFGMRWRLGASCRVVITSPCCFQSHLTHDPRLFRGDGSNRVVLGCVRHCSARAPMA